MYTYIVAAVVELKTVAEPNTGYGPKYGCGTKALRGRGIGALLAAQSASGDSFCLR